MRALPRASPDRNPLRVSVRLEPVRSGSKFPEDVPWTRARAFSRANFPIAGRGPDLHPSSFAAMLRILARGLDIRRATRGARDRESSFASARFRGSIHRIDGSLSGIRSDAAFSMESESEPFPAR